MNSTCNSNSISSTLASTPSPPQLQHIPTPSPPRLQHIPPPSPNFNRYLSHEIISAIQRFILRTDSPPYASLDYLSFGERLNRADYQNALQYYPKNLLDALLELYEEETFNLANTDEWIICAFPEYSLYMRNSFYPLEELSKEMIKKNLLLKK